MRDFLDNLIDRHMNATPQIMPRLPSIFEPEVSHGGLDLASHDDNFTEVEKILSPRPPVRMEEKEPSPVETSMPRSSAQATKPAISPAVTEPAQLVAAPVVSWRQAAHPQEVTVTNRLDSSVPTQEEDRGLNISSAQTVPIREEERVADIHPAQAAASREQIGRVRRARQEDRMEPISPMTDTSTQERPSVSLSPRETPTLPRPSQGGGEGAVRGRNQEFLKPSATLIAPVIPAVAGPERPVSQPEPVINVTIGRIEVRATVSPQKQTPKPESRTPVMGLEEYLRRRSGGQDR